MADLLNAPESAQSPSCGWFKTLEQTVNDECLQVVEGGEQDNRMPLVLWLSSHANQVLDHNTNSLREHQLRALIGVLALQSHNRVITLDAKTFDDLRKNIARRFNEAVNSRRVSQQSLVHYNQWFLNLYLIRLVSQYFQLYFRRGQSLMESIFTPILGLGLSAASAVRLYKFSFYSTC